MAQDLKHAVFNLKIVVGPRVCTDLRFSVNLEVIGVQPDLLHTVFDKSSR